MGQVEIKGVLWWHGTVEEEGGSAGLATPAALEVTYLVNIGRN